MKESPWHGVAGGLFTWSAPRMHIVLMAGMTPMRMLARSRPEKKASPAFLS
ncbi:MAG TPA: hypothetical protein VF903_05345 [Nitrospirota bacterium]